MFMKFKNKSQQTVIMFYFLIVGALTLYSQEPAKLPKAITQKQPNPLKNGERPWLPLSDSEIKKLQQALPDKALVNAAAKRKLLVFYRADDYPHDSIPHWNKCIELLGEKTGAFTATLSQDYADLTMENLKQYDAIFFNNTCRMRTPENVKSALIDFISSGKGIAANHGAGDNWHDWELGKQLIGAEFVTHPYGRIQIKVDDITNKLTSVFSKKSFPYQDEIYAFKAPYSRKQLKVLLSIDYDKSPEVVKAEKRILERAAKPDARPYDKKSVAAVREDKDYGLAWIRKWGKGRFFYCALGHRAEVTFDTEMVKFFLAGIQYAIGDLKVDDSPSVSQSAAKPNPSASEQAKIVMDHVEFNAEFKHITFAAPPLVNSPVFVSAAPDGTVFVSSDPNGSVGTKKGVGRIIRLRDTDGDGVADESLDFAKVDAPRGLVAHGDTVFVLHPPHLSAFTDTDGDGVADQQKILVKNVGWDYTKRRADHGSNGLGLGIDGWLYAAIGDFGFMRAEGIDGRVLQMRGGGVIRVRTDGTGLETFSSGTRNIMEAAISPLLDGFSRDNTNDGGGWNTRFHHFSGMEDHGYPRLYKNFEDEIVKPLADYGGGSGCGAVWVSESGWPQEWNNIPYTVDWGTQLITAHNIKTSGATFKEVSLPKPLARLKPDLKPSEIRVNAFRPTDLDVDARGNLFMASWVNGGFGASPKCGVLFKMSPKEHKEPQLPHFAKLDDVELAKLHTSSSHRTRMEAQRLYLTSVKSKKSIEILENIASNEKIQMEARVAAIFTLRQAIKENSFDFLSKLAEKGPISAWAIRALADDVNQKDKVSAEPILKGLKSNDARVRREAVFAASRLNNSSINSALLELLEDKDDLVTHTVCRTLSSLNAFELCLKVLDNPAATDNMRKGALRSLQLMHKKEAVIGLLQRADSEKQPQRRLELLNALSRLYNKEGRWAGESWGTRPDYTGPYYQPEQWQFSKEISASILKFMEDMGASEISQFGNQLARNQVNLKGATLQLLKRAEKDTAILIPLFKHLADSDELPVEAIPLLIRTVVKRETEPELRVNGIVSLCKADSEKAFQAILNGLVLNCHSGIHRARKTFHSSAYQEKYYKLFIKNAAKTDSIGSIAMEALLRIASNPIGNSVYREECRKALDKFWLLGEKHQAMMMSAARNSNGTYIAPKVARLGNSENKEFQWLITTYFKTLGLKPEEVLKTVSEDKLVASMPFDSVMKEVAKREGDWNQGKQLYTQQGCVACHTTRPEEKQKGPYLGNIASLYKRTELAEAILKPAKTIAQGFATNTFELNDGTQYTGFVIKEAANTVTIRTLSAQEYKLQKSKIIKRQVQENISLMPPGLVSNLTIEQFSSLLSYIEYLNQKNKP